jgi:hypothetical protein
MRPCSPPLPSTSNLSPELFLCSYLSFFLLFLSLPLSPPLSSLFDNPIDGEGAKALADALHVNKTLTTLK